jgi:TRAP-type uncharacterized transport system fused permease subunit
MLSMVTPPVCLASYAAASIGKTDPIKTGWEAMRLCAIAYLIPFLFVFSPTLLLIGPWHAVTLSVATAIVGAILLGIGIVGFLFRPIGAVTRSLFVVAATALLIPVVQTEAHASLTLVTNVAGLFLAVVMVGIEWAARSKRRRSLVESKASLG